ncbi:hypothetical protein [Herpetosiphon sp. NSE202]|uniref:hypothetical protein n=1 Tax=Herpetosiphon sp. NSE202 TaxID=3351349 RepID=UPI003632E166
MLSKFFDWIKGNSSLVDSWQLQTLNWRVEEYQLDWELAESEATPNQPWLSVRATADLLDHMVNEQWLTVFCYHNQEFAQADGIWFEMLVDYDLVIILANDAEPLFAPLAQQYRKLSTSTIRDNRANQLIWQHDVLLPEAIIEHTKDLMIISHDADSIFLIRQDQ